MSSAETLLNPSLHILQNFRDDEDPIDVIATIQKENRVRVPSVQPAMSFLDLHEMSREEVHQSLLQKLKETLTCRLGTLEPRAMKRLLDKSFQYIAVPELRSVVMGILEAMPRPIQERYLLEIVEKEELYQDCPISIKQEIWKLNPGVFGEAVSPFLDQYIASKESLLFAVIEEGKESVGFFKVPPKTRRQNVVLKKLVEMLGSSVPLYKTLCQFLRTLFLRTHISHYCTLRADLVMLLHEQDNEITDSDRCHKFAWCLDACIRISSIDEKKLRELYTFLDTIEGGDEVLEDVSMLLHDPFARHAICQTVVHTINKLISDNKLPRESQQLENLIRLLSIGLKSLSYLDTKSYTGDPLDSEVIVKFLPELMSIIVESQLKNVHNKLKLDHPIYTPSSHFTRYLSTFPAAMQITCVCLLHLIEKKDIRTVLVLLPPLAKLFSQNDPDTIIPDGFLHMFVVCIVNRIEFIRENHLSVILREFFVPCAQHSETVLLYLCRLLWAGYRKVKPDILNEVLQEMEPSDQVSHVAHEQYKALLRHIHQKQEIEEGDQMDL